MQVNSKNNIAEKEMPSLPTQVAIASGIAAVILICLSPCLGNEINLWDDNAYLKDNVFIKDLSWQGIRNIFYYPVMGNYHPLTILSYALEYSVARLQPWLYHFDSLLMHVIASLLVFWFVLMISKRPAAAIVTALLFGLHPMHVESVAWVSGRKDVLCGIFYMAACICYVGYIRAAANRRISWYSCICIFFIAALLSKGVAVTLPVTFLLLDYYEGRKFNRQVFVEKIPLFALALIFGIVTIRVQHSAGAMDMHKVVYAPLERLALGGYALVTYLWKAVVPAGLHAFYPYPSRIGNALRLTFYVYPAIALLGILAAWRFFRNNKTAVFGLLFFVANIVLLLQLLPVGEAIVAERYTYLPYIGLFFMAGWWVSGFFEPDVLPWKRNAAMAVSVIYISCLGCLSYQRCQVWQDEEHLWTDEIANEPVLAPQAYNNLGYIYSGKWAAASDPAEKKSDYDAATDLLAKAIILQPDYINPYVALGELQRSAGAYDLARATFFNALKLHPKEANLFLELAILYYIKKDKDSAGIFFRKELEADPSSPSYGNYGNYLESVDKNDSALLEYNKAISLSSTNYILFENRGKLYKKLKKWDDADKDFQTALRMNPENAELYYVRSFCDSAKGDKPAALRSVEKAISLGYGHIDTAYFSWLKR